MTRRSRPAESGCGRYHSLQFRRGLGFGWGKRLELRRLDLDRRQWAGLLLLLDFQPPRTRLSDWKRGDLQSTLSDNPLSCPKIRAIFVGQPRAWPKQVLVRGTSEPTAQFPGRESWPRNRLTHRTFWSIRLTRKTRSPVIPEKDGACGAMITPLVEDNGLEPMTFWLPARRSPN